MPRFTSKVLNSIQCGARRMNNVRRAVACLLAAAVIPAAAGGQSGTVTNRAAAVFTSGGSRGEASAEVSVLVAQSAALRLVPPQVVTAEPGSTRLFAHQLTNLGSTRDNFTLNAVVPAGWAYTLYLDVDGDGVVSAADKVISGPIPLDQGATAAIILVIDIPSTAPDAQFAATLSAVSTSDPSVSGVVRDEINIRRAASSLSIIKNASVASASTGDTIAYTISYRNTGEGTASRAAVTDLLPSGVRFVSGSLRHNSISLTDGIDGDAGSVSRVDDGRDRIDLRIGDILPGASGVVTLKVIVTIALEMTVSNVAQLMTNDSVRAESNPAQTNIRIPRLRIVKTLASASEVFEGDTVSYRIAWANESPDVSIRNAVITDTIPSPLEFVSAEGSPQVNGRIVTWEIGTLDAGQSGAMTVRVHAAGEWESEIVNRVTIRATNAAPANAAAAALRIAARGAQKLEISKRAGVLEASLGDAIPYIVTVRNAGTSALQGIVISDKLPEGVEFVKDKLSGADSAHANGRDVTVWMAAPLAAGEERSVRYVVSLIAPGSAASLSNMVSASAANGRVRSDTASAVVQIKRGFSLQSRILVGKVWLDNDGDNRQNDGEEGIAGVEVWSEDGEVAVTDQQGRYSFRNLRLGSHAFRLDTLGLPRNTRIAKMSDLTVRVRMDGWTTPRADFRVLPSAAALRLASTTLMAPGPDNIDVRRTTTIDTASIERVSVAPMRSANDRADESGRSFVRGPVVRFFSPLDGAVVTTNRLFVGVQGEAGATVRLYNGPKLISDATLRPDGKWDFIGVDIPVGSSNLRIAMDNSFSNEMWDSVRVHRSGSVVKFEDADDMATLRAESQDVELLKVRVTDSWGVPVPGTVVTVAADEGVITANDEDRTAVGIQLRTNSDGVLRVPVRAGSRVGPATLELSVGNRSGRVGFRVLPSIRSFITIGAGQIGIGAAPKNFAAVTMKGAIGKESSVSVSYDSRRGSSDDEFFGRGYDPLDEGRYPAVGDASERRILSGSTQELSAKIERGFDWVELGDIETGDFSGEGRLSSYTRSLTGVGARVSSGPVTWRAFGSKTDQVLSQIQVRGNGSSGPYTFGKGIRPGTDKIAVEVRSADNASIVIAREELQRFRDYQIDYSTGEVLLQRPLASLDASGNPLFLVGMLELKSGGDSRMIVGGRIDIDARAILRAKMSDSLRFYILGVHDGGEELAATRRNDLIGGGMRMQKGLFHAGAEMLRVASFDSAAHAQRFVAGFSLPSDRGGIEAEWTEVGAGFVAGMDPRLSGASQDLRITGMLRITDKSTLRITDTRQKFSAFGVERHSTMISAATDVMGRQITAEGGLMNDRFGLDAERRASSYMNGKVKAALNSKSSIWVEGSHTLDVEEASTAMARPDQVAAGLTYTLFDGVQLESSHRWVGVGSDSTSYSVSSVMLRTESLFGGRVWAGVDRAAGSAGITSATLGWKPQVTMVGGWSVNGMVERRMGLNRASLADPLRALPFPQIERDRWSVGLGTQWLPKDSAGRMSIAGEVHRDDISRGRKIGFAAEAPVSEAAAFMVRSDWWSESRETGTNLVSSRQDRSILGLALRPASSNAFNVLAKMEWRRNSNPGMGSRFSGTGNDQRLIGSTDAIWGLRPGTEIGGRYAMRMTMNNDPLLADSTSVRSLSHFAGGRIEQVVAGPLSLRIDARYLRAGTGVQRWNAAPSALMTLGGRIDVEGGYRFGNLRDADFAAQGGKGFFATLGVRVTERALKSVTGFWRDQMVSDKVSRFP